MATYRRSGNYSSAGRSGPTITLEYDRATGTFSLPPTNNLPDVIRDRSGKAIPNPLRGGYGEIAKLIAALAQHYGVDPFTAAMQYTAMDVSGYDINCSNDRGHGSAHYGYGNGASLCVGTWCDGINCDASMLLKAGQVTAAFSELAQFHENDFPLDGYVYPRSGYRLKSGTAAYAPLSYLEIQKDERKRLRDALRRRLDSDKAAQAALQSILNLQQAGISSPQIDDRRSLEDILEDTAWYETLRKPDVDPPTDAFPRPPDPRPDPVPTPKPRPLEPDLVPGESPGIEVGSPRPHQPPPRGSVEVKLRSTVLSRFAFKAAHQLTERGDDLKCIWGAIPKWKQQGNKWQKIEHDPPLHEVPKRRYFDGKKWVTRYATDSKGRRITTPRPQDMLQDLRNHYDKVDWSAAAKCWIVNHITDEVIGRTASAANAKYVKAYFNRNYFGLGSGPAL